MWKKKKEESKKQSMENVELNEDQLGAVNGGLVSQASSGNWHVVTKDGMVGSKAYSSKSAAQAAAIFLHGRSSKVISWDEVTQRRDAAIENANK